MHVLDFTSSVDISTREIVSIEAVPVDLVPPIKWGNLLAQDGKLIWRGAGVLINTAGRRNHATR